MPTGIYSRKPHSEETKRKMRIAHLGKKYKPMSEVGKKNISKGHLGIEMKPHVKILISERFRAGKNYNWKGDKVGYRALHNWVENHLGKPKKCEDCGKEFTGRMHWANISQQYKRDLKDWRRLCPKCHGIFDKLNRQKHA